MSDKIIPRVIIYGLQTINTPGHELVYVGVTTKPLSVRLNNHRNMFKSLLSGKTKQWYSSYDIMCKQSYEIKELLVIENCKKSIIHAIENMFILQYADRCVNKNNPSSYCLQGADNYFKRKFTCSCGAVVIYVNRRQHYKSKKHQKSLVV